MKIFDKFKISAKKENSNQATQNLNVHNYHNMTSYEIEVLKELKSIHKSLNRLFRKVDRIELRVDKLEKDFKNESMI